MKCFFKDFLLYDEKDKPIALLEKSEDKSINGVELSTVKDEHFTINNINNQKLIERPNKTGIVVSNASAKWARDQQENSLNNINLTVKPGRLVAIIGPVGAGKVQRNWRN